MISDAMLLGLTLLVGAAIGVGTLAVVLARSQPASQPQAVARTAPRRPLLIHVPPARRRRGGTAVPFPRQKAA